MNAFEVAEVTPKTSTSPDDIEERIIEFPAFRARQDSKKLKGDLPENIIQQGSDIADLLNAGSTRFEAKVNNTKIVDQTIILYNAADFFGCRFLINNEKSAQSYEKRIQRLFAHSPYQVEIFSTPYYYLAQTQKTADDLTPIPYKFLIKINGVKTGNITEEVGKKIPEVKPLEKFDYMPVISKLLHELNISP